MHEGTCSHALCSHVAVCIICVYQLDTSLFEDAVSAQNRQLNADSTKRKAQEINQGNGGGKKNERNNHWGGSSWHRKGGSGWQSKKKALPSLVL